MPKNPPVTRTDNAVVYRIRRWSRLLCFASASARVIGPFTVVLFILSTGSLLAGTPSDVSETAVVVFAGTTTATPTLVNVKFGAVPPNAGHDALPVSIAR